MSTLMVMALSFGLGLLLTGILIWRITGDKGIVGRSLWAFMAVMVFALTQQYVNNFVLVKAEWVQETCVADPNASNE